MEHGICPIAEFIGDSATSKGQIAYFSLRMRKTAIFLLPVENLTSPSCSPTPISYIIIIFKKSWEFVRRHRSLSTLPRSHKFTSRCPTLDPESGSEFGDFEGLVSESGVPIFLTSETESGVPQNNEDSTSVLRGTSSTVAHQSQMLQAGSHMLT